jgi:hypothetical protein
MNKWLAGVKVNNKTYERTVGTSGMESVDEKGRLLNELVFSSKKLQRWSWITNGFGWLRGGRSNVLITYIYDRFRRC